MYWNWICFYYPSKPLSMCSCICIKACLIELFNTSLMISWQLISNIKNPSVVMVNYCAENLPVYFITIAIRHIHNQPNPNILMLRLRSHYLPLFSLCLEVGCTDFGCLTFLHHHLQKTFERFMWLHNPTLIFRGMTRDLRSLSLWNCST